MPGCSLAAAANDRFASSLVPFLNCIAPMSMSKAARVCGEHFVSPQARRIFCRRVAPVP